NGIQVGSPVYIDQLRNTISLLLLVRGLGWFHTARINRASLLRRPFSGTAFSLVPLRTLSEHSP
ncbi:MAG: hypothetical protein ACXW4C_08650, partial [Nitrospira sp.]